MAELASDWIAAVLAVDAAPLVTVRVHDAPALTLPVMRLRMATDVPFWLADVIVTAISDDDGLSEAPGFVADSLFSTVCRLASVPASTCSFVAGDEFTLLTLDGLLLSLGFLEDVYTYSP